MTDTASDAAILARVAEIEMRIVHAPNSEFVRNARTDMAFLCAQLRAARSEIARLRNDGRGLRAGTNPEDADAF